MLETGYCGDGVFVPLLDGAAIGLGRTQPLLLCTQPWLLSCSGSLALQIALSLTFHFCHKSCAVPLSG